MLNKKEGLLSLPHLNSARIGSGHIRPGIEQTLQKILLFCAFFFFLEQVQSQEE